MEKFGLTDKSLSLKDTLHGVYNTYKEANRIVTENTGDENLETASASASSAASKVAEYGKTVGRRAGKKAAVAKATAKKLTAADIKLNKIVKNILADLNGYKTKTFISRYF